MATIAPNTQSNTAETTTNNWAGRGHPRFFRPAKLPRFPTAPSYPRPPSVPKLPRFPRQAPQQAPHAPQSPHAPPISPSQANARPGQARFLQPGLAISPFPLLPSFPQPIRPEKHREWHAWHHLITLKSAPPLSAHILAHNVEQSVELREQAQHPQ